MDLKLFATMRKYVDDTLKGEGAIKGKSAYEVAKDNGFAGSEADWLASLQGVTPHIGDNGNWFIGDLDTNIIASPSLAGYSTEEYVQEQISKINLTPYATKEELSIEIGKIIIPDVTGFITQEDVDKAIAAIPEVDLTLYATKEELQKAIQEIDLPDLDLSAYALKTDIPSLAGYATEDYVQQAIEDIEHPQQDLGEYAKKSEIPDTSGLASETWVKQMIQQAQLDGDQEVDLTDYFTKDEVVNLVEQELSEIVHPIPNLEGYAQKTDLEKFITEDEVNSKIEAIPSPDLSGYAKTEDLPSVEGLASESFVQEEIGKIQIPDVSQFTTQEQLDEAIQNIEHPTVDLSEYIKTTEVQQMIDDIEHPQPDLTGYATEEFVSQKIAEAELSGDDVEVDLSAYYTKSEVDEKFNTIEHPSLDGYATKEDLEKIEVPSIAGLATETYVQEAINSIEHPVTDLTGYATEEFVNSAVENINIPEQKMISVYEINSDNSNIDEIAPEGKEFIAGDMLIVTNSEGIKSAYCYDGEWIACDGNVDASKVIMPMDITLAGSYSQVGNLTKSSTGTATFATKGKSVAAALQEILSKREQPTITASPTISLTFSQATNYEVGTSVTPSWSASLSAGTYTYGPDTGITAKTWSISDTDGNTATTATGSFPAFTVEDGDNYSITASVTHDAGAIAYDNLGDESNPNIRINANSASAVTKGAIKGYRSWFLYIGTDNESNVDSSFVRKMTNKGNGSSASTQNNQAVAGGTKRIVVAIPKAVSGSKFTYNKKLTSVIDVDGMGLDVFGNFTEIEVNVEGKNGYTAVPYRVWVCENPNGLAATKYNFVIS